MERDMQFREDMNNNIREKNEEILSLENKNKTLEQKW